MSLIGIGLCCIISSVFGVLIDNYAKSYQIKRLYCWFLVLAFSVIAAVRTTTVPNVPDTEVYKNYIIYISQDVNNYGLFHYSEMFELGYEMFVRFFVCLGCNYKFVFFFNALLILGMGRVVFDDKELPITTWLLFFSFFGISFSFIYLRAGVSIVFFVYFVRNISVKKKRALLSLIISFLFHKSVLFAIVIFIFSKLIKRFKVTTEFLILYALFIIYTLSLGNLIAVRMIQSIDKVIDFDLWNRFVYYLHDFRTGMFNVSIRLVFNLFIYCIAQYLKQKRNQYDKHDVVDKMVFWGLAINLFLGSNTVVGRMVDFLLIMNIFNMVTVIKSPKIAPVKEMRCKTVGNGASIKKVDVDRQIIFSLLTIFLNLVFIYRIVI